MADLSLPRQFAQAQLGGRHISQQTQGGIQQGLAQVAMVVGAWVGRKS